MTITIEISDAAAKAIERMNIGSNGEKRPTLEEFAISHAENCFEECVSYCRAQDLKIAQEKLLQLSDAELEAMAKAG